MTGKATRLLLMALLLLFIVLTGAHADTKLPADLTVIQAQAFENNTSMEDVALPDGLTRIESRAFAGSSVGMIYMPESIEYIAPDAFDGCENVIGWGVSGTYAEGWCGEHDVPYEAETHAAADFVYVTKDALTAKLTGYVGTAAIVVIPGEIDGYYIDEITASAFRGNSSIHHVTIPAETETIDADAFRNCTGLKSVTLNEGLATIGNNAFSGTALNYVAFPRSLKTIGGGAFSNCTRLAGFSWPYGLKSTNTLFEGCANLTSYTIPLDVIAIPNNMFRNVRALSEIHLPEGLETIGNSAFEGTSLSEIAFPSTLTELGDRAFYGCTNIQQLDFSQTNLVRIGHECFAGCTALTDVNFYTDTLNSIESRAFSGCVKLTAALLPDSVSNISTWAFRGCEALSEFTWPLGWTTANSINSGGTKEGMIFEDCKALRTITVPEGVTAIPAYAMKGCNYLRYINLPSTLTTIGNGAFRDCTAITAVDFSSPLTIIGIDAFRGCSYLRAIDLTETALDTIGVGAFRDCVRMTAVVLPDSVTHINTWAFAGCTALCSFTWPLNWTVSDGINSGGWKEGMIFQNCEALESITVPEGVTAIPACALEDANYLRYINLPSTLTSIGTSAFRGCSALTAVDFPNAVTYIGNYAFSGCSYLRAIDLTETALDTIGVSAFRDCVRMTSVVLPDSVTHINTWAFAGCTALSSFTWPLNWTVSDGINSGGWKEGMLFQNCEALESITVPEGVTAIPACALEDANYLKYVQFPSTLTEIKQKAFKGCASLEELDLSHTALTRIDYSAFENCTSLTSADLPDSVTHINTWAFSGCTALSSFTWPLNWTVSDGVNSGGWKEGMVFQNCEALESITVPEGVTAIPACALKDANCLCYINLPSTLTSIGDSAFQGCVALTEVDFPNALTHIGKNAFRGCSYLGPIDLTESALNTIDVGAFRDCASMTSVELPDSVTHINTWAFAGCTALSSFTWPLNWTVSDGINSGGWKEGMIFQNCEALESIIVPEGVTAIPACALEDANCLRYVQFPSTLTEIKQKAFKGCASLEELDLGHTAVTRIDYSAFENCTSLISADLPDSVTHINTWAFRGCASLGEFTCPMSWTTVEGLNSGGWKQGMIFKDCAALTRIVVPQGAAVIPAYAFTNLGAAEIFIPDSVVTIGDNAFLNCGDILLKVASGSYAESYAIENSMDYSIM